MIQRPVVEFCYLTDVDSILDPNAPSLWCKLATAVLVIVGVLALWGLTLWALVVDQTDHALWAVLVAVLRSEEQRLNSSHYRISRMPSSA